MHSIAERLDEALARWVPPDGGRPNKKRFASEMAARLGSRGGQMGVSYQSILAYFDGTSEPSLEWLREAADLLGVRKTWLTFHEGASTDEEEERQRLASIVAAGSPEYDKAHDLVRTIYDELVPLPHPRSVPSWAVLLVNVHASTGLALRELATSLRTTVDCFGLDVVDLDEQQLRDLTVSMLPIFEAVARYRKRCLERERLAEDYLFPDSPKEDRPRKGDSRA